jgi:hypothetical protein
MSDLTASPAPVSAADGVPSAPSPEQAGAVSPPSPGRAAHSQSLEAALAAPFEITFHDMRAGIRIEYLTGEQVISRLLEVLGACGWSFRILEHGINSEADEVWVLGELQLLLDPDDRVVRQQFGSAKIKRSRSTGAPRCCRQDSGCTRPSFIGLRLWSRSIRFSTSRSMPASGYSDSEGPVTTCLTSLAGDRVSGLL